MILAGAGQGGCIPQVPNVTAKGRMFSGKTIGYEGNSLQSANGPDARRERLPLAPT